MSYDAGRISELLAQLQNSSAFQSTVTPSPGLTALQQTSEGSLSKNSVEKTSPSVPPNSISQNTSGPSVFELLSRLNPGVTHSASANTSRPPSTTDVVREYAVPPHSGPSGSATGLDLRYMTVQQALPIISRLVQRGEFRKNIKKMQDLQNQLEQSLYSDQQGVMNKHEERVTYARNRANIIGELVGEQQNQELATQLATDLKKFHSTRVLVAWDAQRVKQQSQMESLGVPCMFITSEPAALQRQQRVLRILLESINESEDME